MSKQTMNRVSGWAVLALAFLALFLVAGATTLTLLGRFDPAPGGDEGTPAHLFQLATVLLFPAGLSFLLTADWREPLKVARRLLWPGLAVVAAFALLYFIEHR